MSSSSTLTGLQIRVAVPTLPRGDDRIRRERGPRGARRNGRVFSSFSASATDADFCLGLLTASTSANLLDPEPGSSPPGDDTSEVTGARLVQNVAPLTESQFRVLPRLTEPTGVFVEAVSVPGQFLTDVAGVLRVVGGPDPGAVTFLRRPGLTGSGTTA